MQVIATLTAKLVAVPEAAWPRLTAACDQREALPSPIAHASVVGAGSILATMIGAAIAPGRSLVTVLASGVAAAAGYLGAAAVAVMVVPRVLEIPETVRPLGPRFASAAVLPIVASGLFNVVPIPGLGFVWTVVGAALAAWSGWIGASALLGLEGPARRKAAVLTAALGALPPLVASGLRLALIP